MTNQQSQYPDEDLDRTDQLPILQGTLPGDDIEDDAVPMDHTAVLPGSHGTISGTAINEWLDEDGQPKYGKEGSEPSK